MSALGQKATSRCIYIMSALPPKADMAESKAYVRLAPQADTALFIQLPHFKPSSPHRPCIGNHVSRFFRLRILRQDRKDATTIRTISVGGGRVDVSNAAMLSAQKAGEEPLLVAGSFDIHSSVVNDTIVRENCFLHVRGNLLGNLTIERGAKVIVEGSVAGKIINGGGRLVVNHKPACVTTDGPAEAEACGVLLINLTAIASNWDNLAKRSEAECAAVIKGNAYGCGIEPITGALAKAGCRTFFVSNIPEAKH